MSSAVRHCPRKHSRLLLHVWRIHLIKLNCHFKIVHRICFHTLPSATKGVCLCKELIQYNRTTCYPLICNYNNFFLAVNPYMIWCWFIALSLWFTCSFFPPVRVLLAFSIFISCLWSVTHGTLGSPLIVNFRGRGKTLPQCNTSGRSLKTNTKHIYRSGNRISAFPAINA